MTGTFQQILVGKGALGDRVWDIRNRNQLPITNATTSSKKQQQGYDMKLTQELPEEMQKVVDNYQALIDRQYKKIFAGFENTSTDQQYNEHQTRKQFFLDSTEQLRAQIEKIWLLFSKTVLVLPVNQLSTDKH